MAENITAYLPKRKQKMFELIEQPISKKEVEKAQLSLVSLAKEMSANDEINLEELLEDSEDMV